MTARSHDYDVTVSWTGNRGHGTRSYDRSHEVISAAASAIAGSPDPAFRGDATRWNPEQLLVASLSQCHMLWYLHLASVAGVVVTGYKDHVHGVMVEEASGAGQFESVTLCPHVTVTAGSGLAVTERVHGEVGQWCFVARSVNFPVHHEAVISVE